MLTIHCRTDCFKNCFFPSTPNDWYKLHETIRNSESISIFKSRLLSFIRPLESNVHNIFDPIGLKFLTPLRFMNPLYFWSLEIEDISYYLLHCHHFSHYRIYLTNSVKSILENIESLPDSVKKDILLYFYILLRLDRNKNTFILETTLTYILRMYFLIKDSSLLKITHP